MIVIDISLRQGETLAVVEREGQGELMSSPVGKEKYPIVDCDIHPMVGDVRRLLPFMSESWRRHFEVRGMRVYARARDRYNHPNITYRADAVSPDGGPAGSDKEYMLATHIKPFGIASALLLPQQPYGVTAWGDPDSAHAFYAASNDYFFEQWVPFDDRMSLAVTVSPHDPKAAAAEVRRFAGQPGVVGIQLLLLDTMLGSYTLDPIYEAAVENDLPVVVHQSGSEGCYYGSQGVAGGVPRSYGERHVVLTQVGAANVVDVIVNGTLEKFPGLKFVMVEWGFSWLSHLLSRMDLLWQRDPKAAPRAKKLPSEYVREAFTFSTQPLDETESPAELTALFETPGLESMLLFSSDYPHYDADDPGFVMARIPDSMRAKVCYENALATFGDKVMRFRDPAAASA
jgi:predicted TIM-barrel fold metal-dependent hydrolase